MNKELFNQKTVKRLCSKIDLSSLQKKAANEWLSFLEQGKLEREKLNYFKFGEIILKDLLGYDIRNMSFEEGNIEFSFKNKEGRTVVGIEAKGTKIKDLFAEQSGYKEAQKTPIDQLWTYMGKLSLDYGIATNYKIFVLIDRLKGSSTYHFFDFEDIKSNDEKLKEFVAIFSKGHVIDKNFIEKLEEESAIEEKNFTKEFYKIFHETRLMLLMEFQENGASREESIKYAQLFLNRLLFVFFAEDTDKLDKRLFEDLVIAALKSEMLLSDQSKIVADTISSLFRCLNEGSNVPRKIFGFNGGLFNENIPSRFFFKDFRKSTFFKDIYQKTHLKKEIELDAISKPIFEKYQNKLNPIIKNLLIMASFDFKSEVNVNILGHIFEQSLSDLEELKEGKVSKRKKEGIYYTPEYVTDYICRNTIISYLSRGEAKTPRDLVLEYTNDIKELEKKFNNLKILDPACGSGAFLIKAVDVLLEIHKEMQLFKEDRGEYTAIKRRGKGKAEGQLMLLKWWEEEEAREIIENNIFGVDINEESVEITKLSLFLKVARKNRKLIDLSKNIKCGNSLIDNDDVDKKAFLWKENFKEIFDDGGFDIIIGNPPYIRQELVKDFSNYFENTYHSYSGKADVYTYFFERASNLLKDGGLLGFISSGKFLEANYGKKLIGYLCKNMEFNVFINFGDLPVFENVSAYPIISISKKSKNQDYSFLYYDIDKIDFANLDNKISKIKPRKINIHNFIDFDFKFFTKDQIKLINKISQNSIPIKDFCGLPIVGIKTGCNEAYITGESTSPFVKPYIFGKDIKKYGHPDSKNNIVFPYEHDGSEYNLIDITRNQSVQNVLNESKEKLSNRAIICDGIKNGSKKWFEYQQINRKVNFNREYIVYPNVSLGNNFTFSSGNIIDMTCFLIKSNSRYLLAVLNSKVVEFLMKMWAISRRGGYLEYKVQYISRIPMKRISTEEETSFEKSVNSILKLNKEFGDLQDRFIRRIKQNYKLSKITNKLKTFYRLSFVEFCKELEKMSVVLSLELQDELEDYFEKNRRRAIELLKEIDLSNDRINNMVYKVYNITDEEAKIVEESLN